VSHSYWQRGLWLSLAVEFEGDKPEPLPNLDFKIECGDSLSTPDPQHISDLFRHQLVEHADHLADLKGKYMRAHGSEKKQLAKSIQAEEAELRAALRDSPAPQEAFDWRVEFAEVFTKGGFDIALANPPYGASVADSVRDLYFDKRKDGSQSKDTYGLFIARGLQLLQTRAHLCYIVSDTWRTITSHRPLRKRLLGTTTLAHVIDLPPWIFKATVNTCVLTVMKSPVPSDHTLISADLRGIERGDWDSLAENLVAIAAHSVDVQTTTYARYTYPQDLIGSYDNLSFFIGSPRLYRFMSDKRFTRLGNIADVKTGLQTGDNEYYLRKRKGARGSYEILDERKLLTEKEIANLTEKEKSDGVNPANYGGRHFLPYDKGGESDAEEGWLPNYYVPTHYFIDWSKEAVHRLHAATIADVKKRWGEVSKIKPDDYSQIASYIRNSKYYFRQGLTASRVGMYSPTFRLTAPGPFDSGCSNVYSDSVERILLCGLLVSKLLRYLFIQLINHTVNSQVDDLKDLPIDTGLAKEDAFKLSTLVKQITKKQKADPRYPYYLHEQKEIDALIYQLYSLSEEDIREVELWYCRRYPKLAEAQGALAEVREKYVDHLARCARILEKPPSYWRSNPILSLIAQGEGPGLEFKETLEADAKTGERHPGVLLSTLKTIAGFLNTQGGTLLIGVSDSGEINGLEKDFRLCNKANPDGFQQKVRSLLNSRFDPAPIGKVEIKFEELPDGSICRVDVKSNSEIVHLDGKDVYIRDGNTTRKLEGPTLTRWISERTAR